MKLPPLIYGTLIKRYKRFLADVELEDGSVITAHCPNTGRMTTCADPGWKVALSDSNNPKRKHRFTWELVHNGDGWISVNTGRANQLAYEAVSEGWIPSLAGYDEIKREQSFGDSRFDLLLRSGEELCYVEVKNVTLLSEDGCYAFPDAVTERGRKHLNELVNVVNAGHRAAMLFVVSRSDGTTFRTTDEVDPEYGDALRAAEAAGVEVHVWGASISSDAAKLDQEIGITP